MSESGAGWVDGERRKGKKQKHQRKKKKEKGKAMVKHVKLCGFESVWWLLCVPCLTHPGEI